MRRPAAVSMKESEYSSAKERAEALGLTFSAYVNTLIRRDMEERGDFVLKESAAKYKVAMGRPKKGK